MPVAWSENSRCVSPDGVAYIQGFECIFANVLRVLVPFLGLALFVMLIAGAFQYMTAGGDPKAAQKAKSALTSALAGLVLFFGVWLIIRLIETITGVRVRNFEIPGPN